MSRSKSKPADSAPNTAAPKVQTRIDPPHVIADGSPPPDVDVVQPEESAAVGMREAVAVGQSAASQASSARDAAPIYTANDQLHLQAEQLATHLRTQQDQLDRREADLHAQVAQYENSTRSARLWFRERQQELTEREADVVRKESELDKKRGALGQLELGHVAALEQATDNQRRQAEALANRERELDARQKSLERQESENNAVSAALARSAEEQKQFDERLRARQRNLEEAEALLADSHAEIDEARRHIETDRRAWQERCDAERRDLEQSQARAAVEAEKKLHVLKARAEHLERRTAAVDQLRAEVLRAQRESLELRLATDELWSQMMGAAPPAALSHSLAQIRGKLAEQYRLERGEIAGQQKDLEMLATRLDQQRERLQQQKQELEQLAANRQADIEGQAARLAAREQQLDRRQAELDQLRLQQETDRRAYEREIRRLLGQLRRDEGLDVSRGMSIPIGMPDGSRR